MKKQYTMIETISMFRMRYVVEIPKEYETAEARREYVESRINTEQFDEFSQKHLGEIITSTRELDEADVLEICDADNPYAKSWPDSQKLRIFVLRNSEEKHDGK